MKEKLFARGALLLLAGLAITGVVGAETLRDGAPLDLRIRVTNLWANRLIGDDIQFADDCEWSGGAIRKIPQWVKDGKKSPTGRCTFTTWKHWKKTDKLRPSGLLGPVVLR